MNTKSKSKIIIPLLIASLSMTACGENAESSYNGTNNNAVYEEAYDYAESSYADEYMEDSAENSDNGSGSENKNAEKKNDTSDTVIKKEMLVYRCNLVVDVLEFDAAMDTFKNNLESYGAFADNENYNDGGSASRWQYDDEEKWKTYTATIRVPSSNYNDFCDATAALGDLRSKNANVENLSHEYYDLSTELEIYEAKEQRYLDMLSGLDEKTAIAIEEELTSLQIQISKIKTRMNDIKTDVAYSYVNVTINEVKEYVEEPTEPEKTDTFLQRLSITVKTSTSSFLYFMERLLFILIYILPHALVIGLIVFAVVKIIKLLQKKNQSNYNMPNIPMQISGVPPVQNEQTNDDEKNE